MVDLFKKVQIMPVLTPEQQRELHALESEAIVACTLANIIKDVCPVTPNGYRRFDRIPMSDRDYMVMKDGSLRRLPKQQ